VDGSDKRWVNGMGREGRRTRSVADGIKMMSSA
jgi:hypothetical protein